jgi:hypothetical protein
MFGFFTVGLLMCSQAVPAADQRSKLDIPIISDSFSSYFATQRPVRVDVSVCAASGKGEKALDFFILEVTDKDIPNTLRKIMEKSPFIRQMIDTFFDQGTETVMVTEMLSLPENKGKINNFIGIKKSDLQRD